MIENIPRHDGWDYFIEAMKYVDVWYDILDSPDVGDMLDYMHYIMVWAKEKGVWGEDNLEMIKQAKEDWADEE